MSPSLAPADLLNRIQRDVERAAQRSRNGLKYAAGTSRPKVGATPKDSVWSRHKADLFRYRNDDVKVKTPVVIVHSLVSRSYVLDLYPGNSAVAFLLKEGLDVFLLDWGVPGRGRRRQHARALRRRGDPRRDRGGLRGRRHGGGDAAGLLLRRRAQPDLRRPPSRSCRSATSR